MDHLNTSFSQPPGNCLIGTVATGWAKLLRDPRFAWKRKLDGWRVGLAWSNLMGIMTIRCQQYHWWWEFWIHLQLYSSCLTLCKESSLFSRSESLACTGHVCNLCISQCHYAFAFARSARWIHLCWQRFFCGFQDSLRPGSRFHNDPVITPILQGRLRSAMISLGQPANTTCDEGGHLCNRWARVGTCIS